MKKLVIGVVIIVVIGLLVMELVKGEASNKEQDYWFNYYPEVNVYYDFHKSNLLYTVDGGRQWTRVSKDENSLPGTLGRKVSFQSPAADAWKYNEEHRRKYGGVNTNFADEPVAAKTSFDTKQEEEKFKEEEKDEKKRKDERKEQEKKAEKEDDKWLKKLRERVKKIGDGLKNDN